METVAGIIAEGELTALRGFLECWIDANRRLVETWDRHDVPWWYNERASISVFAAAVWAAGDVAFEEFSAQKERRRSKRRFMGRIDLRFSCRGKEFIAEAKKCWPSIGPNAWSAESCIDNELRRARKDVRCVPPDEGTRLAVVFAAPSFPPREQQRSDACLTRWQHIFAAVQCEAKAFVWMRDCSWTVAADDGYVYPAAGVFLRAVST